MSFPRDFHSKLHTADGRKVHISMNRIGRIDGWRFYQSSFDAQGGSVLLVSHDPWGIGLTYAGYALFALAGLPLLFRGMRRKFFVIALLLSCCGLANAAPAVPDSLARSLEEKTVLFRGQAVPYAEMADALTRKLTGRSSVGPLNASRFVASLSVYPQEWARVPFLQVKSRELAEALRAGDGYVAPAALYDSCGAYIPQKLFGESQTLDSEILKLDEGGRAIRTLE